MKVFIAEYKLHDFDGIDTLWLSRLLESMCDYLDLPEGEIEITLMNDEEITLLNQEYRKIAYPTNVLSFPQFMWKSPRVINGIPPLNSGNAPQLWGEVIVSVDTLKKDALDQQIPFLDEMIRICIHGILHLFGYSHDSDAEYDEMAAIEENAINFTKKWIQQQQQ